MQIQQKYTEAQQALATNIVTVYGYDKPVLMEGGNYQGIWLECGPLEGLIYSRFAPEIARNNHEVFFHHQRDDGYFPCWIRRTQVGSAQIQMVVPIAATALETAELLNDEAFLARAYHACGHWDRWLMAHRNSRGTGLCEAFCEFDTGHDNSPRFHGVPKKCPNEDATLCNTTGGVPYLAPDLSASVYGGRVALAKMAETLGKAAEAREWAEQAETLRQAIIHHCYHPDDECFYDVDRDGNFVRIRGDVLTRVLGEHVVDQAMFERIYTRHIKDPNAFWTPYPLPSIAVDDPTFTLGTQNSWGGASQALTALRTPRWFLHYGKEADLRHLMTQWVQAIAASDGFMQQMNPWTGEFTTSAGYSPAMLVFVDFVNRLALLENQ